MTAKAFADTNIVIYAEGWDVTKAQRAMAILESGPVIISQVVTETISTLTRKYGFTLTEAHEVASSLLEPGLGLADALIHRTVERSQAHIRG